jgi:hypothetical protein
LLFVSIPIANAQTTIATDDAESYSGGFVGTNGGTGWGSAFEVKQFGSNDAGGTFLEGGNRLISGTQSFAIFADDGSSGTGAAVTRSVSMTGTNTYRIDVRLRFDLDPNGGDVAGMNLNTIATSSQTAWDDGQFIFLGTVGDGVWSYDIGNGAVAVQDGAGMDFALNGGDIYRVKIDVQTGSTNDIELFIENESSGQTSRIESISVSSTIPDLESIGFANAVIAAFQNLYFDDIVITQNPSTAIPVELADFRAQLDGSDAVLTWRTLSETNNDRFEVQHSAAGAPFRTVGSVEGMGTTTQATSYSFRLDDLGPGAHSFRLRQVDVDGTPSLSGIERVEVGTSGLIVRSTGENPVRAATSFKVGVEQAGPVRVELYNVLGQRVQTLFDDTITPGPMQQVTVNASTLPSGAYFVRTTSAFGQDVQRITVVR